MSYPFVATDAGRSASTRPGKKADCTVRALSLGWGIPYDAAHDMLAAAGRKPGCRFLFLHWLDKQPGNTRIDFPIGRGTVRMNPARFIAAYPVGTFFVHTAHHVFVVRDGVAYDHRQQGARRFVDCAYRISSEVLS